ncbi:unnamed protein product [Prorocentrum cordatum]|uniref:Uncharacterized protein n=1 Tax=Prorocentrum cordatum TaxID=2364126 RepID=A0ABN9WGF4_9DINO|nr:unnamed protein product [Polarella glacialis]
MLSASVSMHQPRCALSWGDWLVHVCVGQACFSRCVTDLSEHHPPRFAGIGAALRRRSMPRCAEPGMEQLAPPWPGQPGRRPPQNRVREAPEGSFCREPLQPLQQRAEVPPDCPV